MPENFEGRPPQEAGADRESNQEDGFESPEVSVAGFTSQVERLAEQEAEAAGREICGQPPVAAEVSVLRELPELRAVLTATEDLPQSEGWAELQQAVVRAGIESGDGQSAS